MSTPSPTEPAASGEKRDASRSLCQRAQDYWCTGYRRFVGAGILAVVLFIAGSVFVIVVDVTDSYFSSMDFCATGCHVMTDNPYAELQKSKHWTTPTGVQPTCANCHVHRRLPLAMIDHFFGTRELFVRLTHDLDKPGAFEELRPRTADRERFKMIKNDSAACRTCHVMEAIQPKRIRGQNQHDEARAKGITCIICHYNLVHKKVEPSPAFSKAIEEATGMTTEEEPGPEGAEPGDEL